MRLVLSNLLYFWQLPALPLSPPLQRGYSVIMAMTSTAARLLSAHLQLTLGFALDMGTSSAHQYLAMP